MPDALTMEAARPRCLLHDLPMRLKLAKGEGGERMRVYDYRCPHGGGHYPAVDRVKVRVPGDPTIGRATSDAKPGGTVGVDFGSGE